MFALNRRYPLFKKLVVAVFAVPLMFAGGSLLGGLAQSQVVGEVGSIDVPRGEYVGRYQSALEEYRRATGSDEVPPEVAEGISRNVRGELLSYYLMKEAVAQKGIRAPDAAVAAEIRQVPDFQDENGEFSADKYTQYVSDRRAYQERVREAIGRESVFRAMAALPQSHLRRQLAAFRRQERVVDEAVLPLARLMTVTLNVSGEEINLFYQRNSERYRVEEQAAFEYFLLSLDDFAAGAAVSPREVMAAYEDFAASRAELARRRASHIYIRDAARAEEVAAQAMAAPARFAELAREHSEDAGSAAGGGSLGIVADGDLPLALNEALFAMTVGQVHVPLPTEDGGYSILKLDELIAAPLPAFREVRAQMQQRARRAAAQDDFDRQVEELRESAQIEIGSLAALAESVNLSVRVAATVYRDAARNAPPFNDAAVLQDAFDPQVVSAGENSAPIPVDDTTYLFARAQRYQPAALRPLAEVRQGIASRLRAGYLADDLARRFRQWQRAPAAGGGIGGLLDTIEWGATHTLLLAAAAPGAGEEGLDALDGGGGSAAGIAGLDDIAVDWIYAADPSRGLPTYIFQPQEDAVRVFRIRAVNRHPPQEQDYQIVDELLEDMAGRLTGIGYMDDLTAQYDYEFYNLPQPAAQQ